VLDVEIDSVEDGVSKRSNRSVSTEEGVPDESGKSLSLRSRRESVSSTGSAERDEDLLSLALAVLDVRSDRRTLKHVRMTGVRSITVVQLHRGVSISVRSRPVVHERKNDDVISRIFAIVLQLLFRIGTLTPVDYEFSIESSDRLKSDAKDE